MIRQPPALLDHTIHPTHATTLTSAPTLPLYLDRRPDFLAATMARQNGGALALLFVAVIVNQASAFFLPPSTTTPTTRSRSAALEQGAQRTVRTRGLVSAQLQVRRRSSIDHTPIPQPQAPRAAF